MHDTRKRQNWQRRCLYSICCCTSTALLVLTEAAVLTPIKLINTHVIVQLYKKNIPELNQTSSGYFRFIRFQRRLGASVCHKLLVWPVQNLRQVRKMW